MKKYTSEQYSKVFWKLPTEIRDIITSYSTTEHINIIGQKHNLHIDKIGSLVDITFDVMMGIVGTKDFVKELQDALEINALESSVLARDIDENVFKPIKETMTHLYAGRAPYKPSSSLVTYYEEDDEHPSLNKDTLLKEIEDPTPAIVRKEIREVGKVVSTEVGEENKEEIKELKSTPTFPLPKEEKEAGNLLPEVYHEEIVNTAPKVKSPLATSIPTIPISPQTEKHPEISQPLTAHSLTLPKKNESVSSEISGLQNSKLSGDDILSQLSSIKLSQAFVMPKGPEGIRELQNMQREQDMMAPKKALEHYDRKPEPPTSASTQKPTTPASFTQQPPTPQTSEKKIDPYRERI